VDTIIRAQSGNKKSMDDFAHLFLGGENTPPEVKTYNFDDVVVALNQVQPYDWRAFLTDRIVKVAEHAPLAGIENSGWKLVYTDQSNQISRLREELMHRAREGWRCRRCNRGRHRREEWCWSRNENRRRERAEVLA
jgi:predicted metalloprotease with PDZ domain